MQNQLHHHHQLMQMKTAEITMITKMIPETAESKLRNGN
jgi:hypothetical protein